MTAEPDDLTDGWPDEPGAEELARFGATLRGALPALSDAALGRVGDRVRREIAARRRRRRIAFVAAGLAAGLLLAAGLGQHFLFSPAPAPSVPAPPTPETAARVDDRFTVPFAAPQAAVAPDRPAMRFADNQSLFTN